MNLLDSLLNDNGGAVVREIAKNLQLPEGDARSAIEQLTPALSRGLSRNAKQPGGLEGLFGALQSGGHERYAKDPDLLGDPATVADGNAILGHILGSKDVSRNVAGRAAQETGLDSSVLKKMLPMVAAATMGQLGQQSAGGGGLLGQLAGSVLGGGTQRGGAPQQGSGMAGVLESFLDSDRDGAVVDDLFSMARKFF
jgi:hypothetical protein